MSNLVVIPSSEPGGSEHGLSTRLSYLGCRRKTLYDQSKGSSGAAKVGVIFHKMLEIYYSKKMKDVVFKYQEGVEDPDYAEALRLFNAYRENFPPTELGKVLGCEVLVETDDPTVVGVAPYTGRIDMVVELDQEACDQLLETRKLSVNPGVYLMDTKTTSRMNKNLPLKYEHSLQVAAYQVLWNHLNPDTPCLGMIMNVVVRNKKPTFFSTVVGYPPEHQRDVLAATLQECDRIKEQRGEDFVDITECFSFGTCPHLFYCSRITKPEGE